MEFCGYTNKTDKIDYDSNGFAIIPSNPKEFQFTFYPTNQKDTDYVKEEYIIFVSLMNKCESYYTYYLRIILESNVGYLGGVAIGEVKIYFDRNGISKVFVNDIENGNLIDRYDDCFDISPDEYLHLLFNKQTE